MNESGLRAEFRRQVEFAGGAAVMIKEAGQSFLRHPPTITSISNELNQIGVKSFIIVGSAALAVGLVMAMQFGFGLARFGAKLYVPKIVAVSIVRELGPIFTALMLAGRVGAGIASEVGSMKVTQQIDAIRALGTSPYQKIVNPKMIAILIATPILTIMANFIGIFGGLLISSSQLGVSSYDYFFKSFEIIKSVDVLGGILKSVVFAFLIGTTGCYLGLTTEGGTKGVGESTTRAVVVASVLVIFADFVLTKALWILEHARRAGQI